jgi:hypothetical protein
VVQVKLPLGSFVADPAAEFVGFESAMRTLRSTLTVLLPGDVIDRCVEDPHHCENGEEGRFDHDHSFDIPHRGYGNLRLGCQLLLGHAALFAERAQPHRELLGLFGITALGAFLPTRPSHAAILAINFYR